MDKITGQYNPMTDRIDLSDGRSLHRIDFTAAGIRILPNGQSVMPVLSYFINTDYYDKPVEMCLPMQTWSDDLQGLTV